MNSKPLISIITPTYNCALYISEAIKSVIKQSYKQWEMIILDDGSSDSTYEVVSKYKDSRIKYFYQKNRGLSHLSKTYNEALKKCSGEYIAMLDCDDYWTEDKLEIQISAFNNPKVVLSYGITYMVNQKGKKIGVSKIPDDYSIANNDPVGSSLKGLFFYRWSFLPNLTVMLRKKNLDEIGGFVIADNLYQDYPTWVRMSLEGRFYAINKPLGFYRKHISSITVQKRKEFKNTIEPKCSFIIHFINKYKKKLNELGLEFDIDEIKKHWGKLASIYQPYSFYDNAFLFMELGMFNEARESFKKFYEYQPTIKHKIIKYMFDLSGFIKYDIVNPARIIKENVSRHIRGN